MSNQGASGYLLKASAIKPFLPPEVRDAYDDALKLDVTTVSSILDEYLPKEFPPFADVFRCCAENESDVMEVGEIYVNFDEEDLFFPKVPTPAMLALQLKQIKPEFQRWVTWG